MPYLPASAITHPYQSPALYDLPAALLSLGLNKLTPMRKMTFLAIAISICLSSLAQLKTPAPSPTQTIKQDFALSSIEVSYSRPGIKGRKLYSDIAPAGLVWRTGANNATTLTFGDDVTIGGVAIPAGKYGLLSIPDTKVWILIISKQTDVTSASAYKQDMDVVRVPVDVNKLKSPSETLTFQFANIKPNSCDLQIMWGNSLVSLPITTETDAKVMAGIDAAMKTDKPPYYQAALYYMENGKDLNKSLDWFNKAIEAQPDAYWVQHQWANCLAKLGKKPEARAAATRSRELAIAAKNDDYVRLNDKLLKLLK
jgi:tetratricopeptide (TPR) repeat protein